MMELQNPHRDGLHLTKAVNIFLYRNLKSKVRRARAGRCPSHPIRHSRLAIALPQACRCNPLTIPPVECVAVSS